jgi:hypothetical protein
MKNVSNKLLLTAFALGLGTLSNGQLITQGGDDYIGGVPSNPYWDGKDVMGIYDTYNLTGWKYTWNDVADTITVQIYGSYFDRFMANPPQTATKLGDLFISTNGVSWSTKEQTKTDYFGQGTEWDYAVKLGQYDNHYGQLNGYNAGNQAAATVHAVTDLNNQVTLSDAFFAPTDDYRSMQEVNLKNEGPAVGTAAWFISTDEDMLSITINGASTIFGADALDSLGFHWTMTCANDVIEFAVPEPSTIGMLGAFGLLGYLYLRRRITAKRS